MARDEVRTLQRAGGVLDRQAAPGFRQHRPPGGAAKRRRTHSGSTSRRSAAKAGASASPRQTRSCPFRSGSCWASELRSPSPTWSPRPTGAKGVLIQSIPIGFVTALVTAGLLVIFFLDHPYADTGGTIKPTEMQRTLTLIDRGSPLPATSAAPPFPPKIIVRSTSKST